jgi:hypothetical protein
MPYTLSWLDNEQSIMLISADGRITWDEYHAINEQAMEVITSSPHRIDTIFTTKVGVPPGNPLPHFREVFQKWGELTNPGMIMAVETNQMRSFIKAAADIASRLMGLTPVNAAFVASIDEALTRIKADREEKDGAKDHVAF